MRALEAVAAALLLALAGWFGFRSPSEPQAERGPVAADPAAPVVTEGPLREVLVLSGELRATDAELFTVPIAANWQLQLKWLIDEGAHVEPGDVVARFDPSGTQDRLDEAENDLLDKRRQLELKRAEMEQALLGLERDLARAQAEFDKTAVDAEIPATVLKGSDYRDKQLAHAKARRKLENARAALDATRLARQAEIFGLEIDVSNLEYDIERYRRELDALELHARRSGIVVHEYHPWWGRKVRIGDRLSATMRFASIPDLSTLEVEAWASEAEVPRLAPGQRATLHLDALPGRVWTGVVEQVAAKGERRKLWGAAPYFRVRIRLDERDERVMRPGMSVRCEVLVRELPRALRVPQHRIGRAPGDAWVRPEGGPAVPVAILAEDPLLVAVRPLGSGRLAAGMRLADPGPPPEARSE